MNLPLPPPALVALLNSRAFDIVTGLLMIVFVALVAWTARRMPLTLRHYPPALLIWISAVEAALTFGRAALSQSWTICLIGVGWLTCTAVLIGTRRFLRRRANQTLAAGTARPTAPLPPALTERMLTRRRWPQ